MFDNIYYTITNTLSIDNSYNLPVLGEVMIDKFILATITFVALWIIFWIIRMVLLGRAKALAAKTSATFDDAFVEVIERIRGWFYSLMAFYFALQYFELPAWVEKPLDTVFWIALVWQVIEMIVCFVEYGVRTFIEKDLDGDGEIDRDTANASNMIKLMTRIILWAIGSLLVLSNLGIEVTSLIAGLGIGGIAVAFALQGILSDLFASFSIYLDRPFKVGDYIVIGSDSGTVENIGIKSTRLRTLQGEELVVSNAELTTARVNNFKKMDERRIVSQFGITYETPHEKVKMVNGIVERIFEETNAVKLDRVFFTTFADSALVFEIVYFVESAIYSDYLEVQQKFNFELMEKFAELGIEFAYPTQMIYTKSVG